MNGSIYGPEHGPEQGHIHLPPDDVQMRSMWMRNFAPTLAIALLENARKNVSVNYTPESLADEVRAYLDALWEETR